MMIQRDSRSEGRLRGNELALRSTEASGGCGSRAALPTGYQAYDLYQLDAGAEK